jgi:hypothetical protein
MHLNCRFLAGMSADLGQAMDMMKARACEWTGVLLRAESADKPNTGVTHA